MVTQKWSQTLQQLDIANQMFTEEDLEIAMSYLAGAAEADTLQSLNLSGTRITPAALRYMNTNRNKHHSHIHIHKSSVLFFYTCSVFFFFCRSVVGQLTALNYLNLSSCRYLPRGLKRIYRGQEDIRQLLDKLE